MRAHFFCKIRAGARIFRGSSEYSVTVGRLFGYQLPTFDGESKSAKTEFPYVQWGRGVCNQLPTLDPESKPTNQISLCLVGGGWLTNCWCWVQNCLKSKFPLSTGVGEGKWGRGGAPDYVRNLMRIWGELQNFDNNFSAHSDWVHHR